MGRTFKIYLTGSRVYMCQECGTHLSTRNQLVSQSFRGRTGGAWLFTKVFNISEGEQQDRVMTTGLHTIVDIYCNDCGTNLGWKYEEAYDESQKYKQGKFILEKALFTVSQSDKNTLDDSCHIEMVDFENVD